MQLVQERHRVVVRHHNAGEAPRFPQQAREERPVGCGWLAVNVRIGVHDGAGLALANGHFKGRQNDVRELARPHRDGPQVACTFGCGIARKVLEGRHHPRTLHAAHVCGAGDGHQEWILTHGLFHTAPPQVSHHVHHGREALVNTHRTHVCANLRAHALNQRGLKSGRPTQRHWIGRGAPRGKACKAFVVREGGDAKAVGGLDAPLRQRQAQGAHRRVHGASAKRASQLPDAVRHEPFQVRRWVLQVLVGGYRLPSIGRPYPDAHELAHLLLQRHLTYEALYACCERQ